MKIPLATLSLRPSCLRNVGLLLLCLLSAGWLATPAVAAVNATASGNASLTGTGTVSIRWQVSYPITLPQGTTVRGINGVIAVPNGPRYSRFVEILLKTAKPSSRNPAR